MIDLVEEVRCERIELLLKTGTSSKSEIIRLRFWSDRWIWVDARQSAEGARAGWNWKWTTDGRLAGHCSGRELLPTLEASHLIFADGDRSLAGLDLIWDPILARGPRPLA